MKIARVIRRRMVPIIVLTHEERRRTQVVETLISKRCCTYYTHTYNESRKIWATRVRFLCLWPQRTHTPVPRFALFLSLCYRAHRMCTPYKAKWKYSISVLYSAGSCVKEIRAEGNKAFVAMILSLRELNADSDNKEKFRHTHKHTHVTHTWYPWWFLFSYYNFLFRWMNQSDAYLFEE